MNEFPHDHAFLGTSHGQNERRTWGVVGITLAMMVGEIVAGTLFKSMALIADGWHMATHAGALAIAAVAYRYARRHASDPRFTFGTGKLGDLTGFASAIALGLISVVIGWQSFERLAAPVAIDLRQAIVVAVIGLLVNLVSAWLLQDSGHHHLAEGREHAPGHDHEPGHDHTHASPGASTHASSHDHNQRAAYAHVLADAFTSLLAVFGLLAAWLYGWIWMDALMGIVGSIVIARWSVRLVRDSGSVLIDVAADPALVSSIRRRLEQDGDRVLDLHVWRVAPGHHAAAAAVFTSTGHQCADYKLRLADLRGLSHATIEVHAAAGSAGER